MDWARKGPHRGEDLFYVNQLCSTACTREISKGPYFGASEAAQNRIKEIGADKVTNSTIGVMLDNDGNLLYCRRLPKSIIVCPMRNCLDTHLLQDSRNSWILSRVPVLASPVRMAATRLQLQPLAAAVPSITASGTTRCLVIRCLQALGIGALTRPCAAI